MNNNTLASGLVGGVIGFFLALFLMPMWGGMTGSGLWNSMMGPGNGMGTGRMTGQIDAHFIEQMIPHHEDAITMADLAMDKAEHQEIRQLAEDITRTQSEEIEQMKTWYKGWFGKDVPDTFTGASMMHMGMMGGTMDIDSLENATDFDKEFIEQMIPHHQMAVMMATMLQNSTGRPEMQQLAENIVEAQTREIDAMREWYRQWYE